MERNNSCESVLAFKLIYLTGHNPFLFVHDGRRRQCDQIWRNSTSLAKFNSLGQFFEGLLVIGNRSNLNWPTFMLFSQFFVLVNGQI